MTMKMKMMNADFSHTREKAYFQCWKHPGYKPCVQLLISPEDNFHSGERQDSDGCPLPTNRFSFISSLKAAMNFYVHMKRSTRKRGCQSWTVGRTLLRGEDRVREMSRRLASGRGQHSERLQRNTDPIKDRHSISTALKGIPQAYPRAWYMLRFYWTKNRKWCNRRQTRHLDPWKEKCQLSKVSDILPLSIQ